MMNNKGEAIKKGKKSNSQLDKLVASLGSQINDQIAKTKEPFNASSVLEGFKQSEFFDSFIIMNKGLKMIPMGLIKSGNRGDYYTKKWYNIHN